MSDRSFGDHAFRNVVKNPLLSTSVTGLSIEDLTQNAVLLPAVPSQEMNTNRDDRSVSQTRTLAHPELEFANIPSGDTNFNIYPPSTLTNVDLSPANTQNVAHTVKSNEPSTTNVSKASAKSDDDFDVNEYIARLQGTRYVSAPLNSVMKEDQNANLESSEENLEEINLNEDKGQSPEYQQSLTADIAQNFSQLPTVLPQMASVVFNSFSNMLSMKSREQTPDDYRPPEPVPAMPVPDIVKDIAPPPLKEPPTVGAASYRITTRKKVYAQIPGLSSGETVQNIPAYSQPASQPISQPISHPISQPVSQPISQTFHQPQYFIPDANLTQEPAAFPPADNKYMETKTSFDIADFNAPINARNVSKDRNNTYEIFTPVDATVDAVKQTNVLEDTVIHSTESTKAFDKEVPLQSQFLQSADPSQSLVRDAFAPPVNIAPGPGTVIPPPPMFTNQPRKDEQTSVGKSVLPPSVARRISANQPIIKSNVSPVMPQYQNIFVPQSQPESSSIAQSSSPMIFQPMRPADVTVPEAPIISAPKNHPEPSISNASVPKAEFTPAPAMQTNVAEIDPLGISLNVLPRNIPAGDTTSTPMSSLPPSSSSKTILPPPIKASMLPPTMPALNTVPDVPQTLHSTIQGPPVSSAYNFNADQVNVTPPMLFTPALVPNQSSDTALTQQTTFFNPSEVSPAPTTSAIEPPKSSSGISFRMTKKKPSYYSGPIDGVGSISNNVKPVMPPIQSTSFQGSFFTPQEPDQFTQSSQLYSTEAGVGQIPITDYAVQSSSLNDNYSYSSPIIAAQPEPRQDNNTVFDLSRATTDAFEPPQQESSGFGIIGSLKSKLSSIDIGKIQNSVTTFFDPSYNDVKGSSSNTQEFSGYESYYPSFQPNQPTQLQDQAACLNMLVVPNSEPLYQQNTHNVAYETNQYESVISEQNKIDNEPITDSSSNDKSNEVNPLIADYFKSKGLPIPDFSPEALHSLTFTERSALIDAVANALDPSSAPTTEKACPKKTQQPERLPGFVLSFAPNDASLETAEDEPKYPRVVSSKPLNEEEERRLYEEMMNRPADLFETDVCVIEPTDCDSPTPNIPQYNRNTASGSYGFSAYQNNVDPVAQYFSNIGAMPFYDKLLDYNLRSEDTADDSASDHSKFYKTRDNDTKSAGQLKNVDRKKENPRNWIDDVGSYMILPSQEETDLNETGTEQEINKVTKKMIENITAPIQLSNPVEVPLTESNVGNDGEFSSSHFANITHITDEPIEAIPPQSAKELLQDAGVDDTILANYGWRTEDTIASASALRDHSYMDPNSIGFIQNTSMFFDNILTNASDELKAECQVSLDDHVLPRQMSVPSAPPPPVEDDSKSDEGVLDVQLIEQDAKNFMFSQDFVIEPETDDGKIKELERTSDDHAEELDSFTNRVEKYKKLEETASEETEELKEKHVNKPYPSYFDTGNFAADTHYKNSSQPKFIPYGPHNIPMRIPPGFEQEYYRKCNLSNQNLQQTEKSDNDVNPTDSRTALIDTPEYRHEDVPKIPDTTTQTSVSYSLTVSPASMQDTEKSETASDKIEKLVQDFINREPKPKPKHIMEDERDSESDIQLANIYGMSEEQMTEIFGNLVIEHTNSPVRVRRTHEETIQAIMRHLHYSPIIDDDNGNNEQSPPDDSRVESSSFCGQGGASSHIHEESSNVVTSVDEDSKQESLNASDPVTSSTDNIITEGANIQYDRPSTSTQDISFITGADNAMQGANIIETNNESSSSNTHNVMPLLGAENSNAPDLSPQNIKSGDGLEMRTENANCLPDPVSFFSLETSTAPGLSNNEVDDEEQNNFSRLSSYFATPTTKDDHSKSFFELSQSQNHYRQNQPVQTTQSIQTPVITSSYSTPSNIQVQAASNNPNTTPTLENLPLSDYFANMNLVRELASTKNFTPPNVVTTANYFTIHYDFQDGNNLIGEPDSVNVTDKARPIPNSKINDDLRKESNKLGELGETDSNDDVDIINNCKYCCDMTAGREIKVDINNVDLSDKFKHVMDNNKDTDKGGDNIMEPNKEIRKKTGLTVNFDTSSLEEESQETVSMINENRATSEYSPVKHHWFYRVDIEDKSVWRGFSIGDSGALEAAFNSPDLTEATVVATDGGRFDVNVVGRLRTAVYWTDKPTNVRRCSWFYKGTTDARYVPYTEAVAEKLEEEYRHGITTGEWHRRLLLPNNEMVVMHGPAVMVHFLQTNNETFNSSPLAWDANNQSMMRPRVVRRGCAESEIEETEPSSIDHLLLLCHGVGSACDMRFRPVEEVVDDFRTTSLQLLQSHYRNSFDNGLVGRIEVLPISWHSSLHSCETGVDQRLAAVTLESIPRLRSFTNDTILDVLFYTSPVYCQHIIDTVCNELNRVYTLFRQRNPQFEGGVSLGGHSLGSVILYDLLCHQHEKIQSPLGPRSPQKHYVEGAGAAGAPAVKYPKLDFQPHALYALGSPIAIFECIRGVDSLGQNFCLPNCKNFFNIFHPYDPIAYRIEPMINPDLRDIKPQLIPHHKGRKRMHLELKDTMARVGADIKQKIIESIRSTWSSMWKSEAPPDQHLEKVVEEEMAKEEIEEERKEDINETTATPDMLGQLNAGRRIDYVLQEAPFEMINEYLFAMRSHVCYWESEDTMLLILREIYECMGVRPDCSLPPPSLSVQRTRPLRPDESVIVTEDSPSTSRAGS